ncbi:hypothetical protein JCM3770_002324 [Rhodotorula araucariae]
MSSEGDTVNLGLPEDPTLHQRSSGASPSPDPSAGPRSRFYTTASARPFSRSALQRQSVHTLPSIQHLQHGFAKMSILAEQTTSKADLAHGTASLAARRTSTGDLQTVVPTGATQEGEGDLLDKLGPQPNKPAVDLRMPWEQEEAQSGMTIKDARQLRGEALDAVEAVCECWSIQPGPYRPHRPRRSSAVAMTRAASSASDALDISPLDSNPFLPAAVTADLPLIPTLLATTTLAVRAIQSFAISLPSHSSSAAPPPSPRKVNPLDVSTAARPRTSLALPFSTTSAPATGKGKERARGNAVDEDDPLVRLRRTSLGVLGMLRVIEARYRIPDATTSSAPRMLPGVDGTVEVDTAVEISAPSLPPPISPAPAGNAVASPPSQYLVEVDLASLAPEAEVVERWVRAVERVLEHTERTAKRSSGGDAPAGEGYDVQDSAATEKLPAWASETGWEDGLGRAHAVILAHVPSGQRDGLPDPAVEREGFLNSLSDGTLLCRSHNAVLRSAHARPFGFLPSSSIHVLPASAAGPESSEMARTPSAMSTGSDGGERIGGTFRRAENLGQWAAALKHRYSVPLPSFDPRAIAARKSDVDWHAMLADAVHAWAGAVAREAREVWEEQHVVEMAEEGLLRGGR